MPGLLIIAHAPLATALLEVARHAFPDCAARLKVFDVTPEMTPEDVETGASVLLSQVASPDALILTDVGSATPCNGALLLAKNANNGSSARVKVISGVNVPMLWRALGHSNDTLDSLIDCASTGATEGVRILSGTKPQNQTLRIGGHDQDASQHQQ